MASNRSYIRPDETLFVDGKLVIRGNVTQIEDTVLINNLESDTLVINSDQTAGSSQIKMYSNASEGNIVWDGSTFTVNPSLNIGGNLAVDTITINGGGTLSGNSWSGTAAAADALTSAVTLQVTSSDSDVADSNTTFINAGDTVSLQVNLNATGVTPNAYGSPNQTTTFTVDNKGRLSAANDVSIQIVSSQVTDLNTAISSYIVGGVGITESGGVIDLDDTGVTAGTYGEDGVIPQLTINAQGQITGVSNIAVTLDASNITGFGNSVLGSFSAVTTDDGTAWTAANLSYDSGTGVFDYTPPTRSEVRGVINASAPINYDTVNGIIGLDNTINQDLNFTGEVDLANATVPGFTISGNLNVLGDLNSITQEDLYVTDPMITLNANNSVGVDSGVVVNRGSTGNNVELLWNETTDRWQFTNDGSTYFNMPTSTGDIAEGANLWYTDDRVNTAVDAYILAGNGVVFSNGSIVVNVGSGDGITVNTNDVAVDGTVIRTTGDQSMAGNKTITGNIILPDYTNANTTEGAIYRDTSTNRGYLVIGGTPIEITPSIDYGTVDNAPGAGNATIQVFAGSQTIQAGNANIITAGIKGISVGANMTISETGNVITLDADGLNTAEVRAAISATNNGGFGNLTYVPSTGVFTYTGTSVSDVRGTISGTGLIGYSSATGVISTTADNYASWTVQTDTGAGGSEAITSSETLIINGTNGVTVTNSGNTITVSGQSADITEITAGDGLTGGGTVGAVTLDVGAGDGISVTANDVAVDSTVVRTSGDQTIAGAKNFTTDLEVSTETPTLQLTDTSVGSGHGNVDYNGGKITLDVDPTVATPSFANVSYLDIKKHGTATVRFVPEGLRVENSDGLFAGFVEADRVQTTDLTTGSSATAGTITGDWTLTTGSTLHATYADLAEKYLADMQYEPGTVLVFGGDAEVTTTTMQNSARIAGVVSSNPAHIMNAGLEGEYVVDLALRGRVPCKVVGIVKKGDVLVASEIAGFATVSSNAAFEGAACIVGKAIENKTSEGPGVVEIMV